MRFPEETNSSETKVFVTGADGMLGSMICRKLLEADYSVTAACHPNSSSKTLHSLDLQIVKGDILDVNFLDRAIQGHDYVIHVAALLSFWPARQDIIRKVNITGTRNVQVACARHGVKRMVYIGSASSFTEGTKDKPGNEQSPFTGDQYRLDYIDSKYAAQQELINTFAKHGFPVVIINPTFIIGPYDSGPSSGKILINFYRKKVLMYPRGGKNFVFSGDVAKAVVNALTMGRIGECYIAGHHNLEYRELFQKASHVLGRKFNMRKVPQFAVQTVGAINSVGASLTGKPPKLTYRLSVISGEGHYYDPSKAVRELKMPQTPIEEAIEITLKWFHDNDYL